MIRIYTQAELAERWLKRYQGRPPGFACILGFTETGLIPGISAAGATPIDRQYTALADAEFLYHGPQPYPKHPLPPLHAGASPVFITRAIVAKQQIPVYLFNAGLPHPPTVPCIDLGGMPARCLSQGHAIDLSVAQHLLNQGLKWGEQLAAEVVADLGYLILSECVVGGTTTALAVLTGLGWNAAGMVNSSHPTCNHEQKWQVVKAGLEKGLQHIGASQTQNRADQQHGGKESGKPEALFSLSSSLMFDPLYWVAAVGDPMQIVVAGMAIAASRVCGVLLAGGTQMLAVYALLRALAQFHNLLWQPEQILIGTTRWVAEDPTGNTVGLAHMLRAPLVATQFSFANSRYDQFRAYEQGYVKEGVGAGGCTIAAYLYKKWEQTQLLQAIETLAEEYERIRGVGG